MVLKNVVKTGYPFAESIAAGLPICDEFLISEGHSTDGTYEILQKISKLNPKVKVFRQEWPSTRKGNAIAEVTNAIRAKCSYNYIFSIQANEIIHEESTEFIKALPEICPEVQTFSLPFVHLVKDYKFYEDFRLRFSKNLKSITAVGDAWTLGLTRAYTRLEALKSLRYPPRLMNYVDLGIEWTYANSCVNSLSRAIYLPKPVFRYWSLFPLNYLEKCEIRAEKFGLEWLRKDKEILKNYLNDPISFWEKAAEIRRKELGFHYPETLGMIERKDHPKVVKGLLSNFGFQSYQVRQEILDLIKGL